MPKIDVHKEETTTRRKKSSAKSSKSSKSAKAAKSTAKDLEKAVTRKGTGSPREDPLKLAPKEGEQEEPGTEADKIPGKDSPADEPQKTAAKDAVMLVELGFDVREKDRNAAATHNVIGVFVKEGSNLPTSRIIAFLNQHKDTIQYYAGWDGQIYPKFVLSPTKVL